MTNRNGATKHLHEIPWVVIHYGIMNVKPFEVGQSSTLNKKIQILTSSIYHYNYL